MDKYTKKYIRLIKKAESDQELSDIVDKIYTDGFDDGEWETEQPPTTTSKTKPNEDLPRFDKAYHILDGIKDLIDTELHIVSDIDIKILEESLVNLQAFALKQTNNNK